MTVSSPLGETYDPWGAHLADPYPFYAQAREKEPVFFSPAVNAWVVTRHDDVRDVLRHPEVFSSANALRPMTTVHPATVTELRKGYPQATRPVQSDGEEHRRLRAPLARGLSPAKVDAAEPLIRRRAGELVDAFAADGHADLMRQYAYRLPVDVISHLVGLDPDDMELAYTGSYGGIQMIAARRPEAEQAAGARELVRFELRCGEYAQARRAEPRDDLISDIVTSLWPGEGPLTPEQEAHAAKIVSGLYVAGHVTTTALIGNAVVELLTHREQWERLCAQPAAIPAAVEEIARFRTSVQGFLRVTTRPATVGGVDLPAGAEVLLLYGSANRDEAVCERPEEFDVTRPPTRHLAFGTGVHACAGSGLARRELTVTLEVLTRRLPTMRLVDDQDFAINSPMTSRGPTALQVTW